MKTPSENPAPISERGALWHELFGIDLRTVALFRIALALSLLADLFMRSVDIEAFYTDFGVAPRSVLPAMWNRSALFSFHTLFDSPLAVDLVFAINAVLLCLLLVGWNSRAMAVVAWLFLISLQSRNPMVLQGGDILLRCLAFWAMFLPLGAYLSLDAKRRYAPRLPGDDPARPVRAFSWGTIAILVQTACVYWFTALLKNDPSWWQNGYAIYLALNIDLLTTPIGRYLVNVPLVAYALTFITIWMEAFGAFFAFFPLRNGPVRTATVFVFWFFHLVALQSMMYLGPFPWTCALAWIPFLPSWFWDNLAIRLRHPRLSAWAQAYLPKRGEPAKNEPARRPVQLSLPIAADFVAAFYLLVILMWNFRTVNFGMIMRYFPITWNAVAEVPHVDQCWDMFSPTPMADDGWYVIDGTLRDGSHVDLMPYIAGSGEPPPVSWDKPKEVGKQFRDERWRKYMLNMWAGFNRSYRPYLCAYVAKSYNRDHSGAKELVALELVYMRETTPTGYAPIPPPVKVTLDTWSLPGFAPKSATPVLPRVRQGSASVPTTGKQ
ncbi:MAG: HTTM domain-containing protein [Armatimonadetes bacterium]|nr:HTTM domain-containing protein [Armatimonadota bacterium]